MSCAVKVPEMNAIIFLTTDVPENRAGLEFEEGAWVEISPNDHLQSNGTEGTRYKLCQSTTDPRHYKLFWSGEEIDRTEFTPTGMLHGGIYSRSMWERFVEALPGIKAFNAITGNDPPGAMDEAMRHIREAR
jgi:hypothetical protein